MSNELVKIENGGAGGVTTLDPTTMLSSIRTTLESDQLMTSEQSFMISGAPLLPNDEANTPLSEALTTSTGGGTPVLTVATATVPLPSNSNWQSLTVGQQLAFLNTIAEITKGLSIGDPSGVTPTADNAQIYKTTQDAIAPITAAMFSSEVPVIQTSITTNSYFSKFAESMAISSSNSASLSVTTPYGGGESSFDYAQSHSSSSSQVNTQSVGSYNVNIARVELDDTQIQLSADFVNALTAAAEQQSPQDQFVAIVTALNQYGWYLPTAFMVGGALYTTQQSESTSWSEAETTSTSFAASFKASFDGIGGGAAYKQANKSSTSSSGSSGSSSLSFSAIGGSPADSNDFTKWSASLLDPNNWNIASYEAFVPSIFALQNMGSDNVQLLTSVVNTIANQYAMCPELESLQPLVDCNKYALAVRVLLPQFGNGT